MAEPEQNSENVAERPAAPRRAAPVAPYVPPSDEELAAQCDLEFLRATGPGGQNVNRRETAVRLTHRPTGIVVVCRRERTQHMNRILALAELKRRLVRLHRQEKPRKPTKVPRGVRAGVLKTKKIRAGVKKLRTRPADDD